MRPQSCAVLLLVWALGCSRPIETDDSGVPPHCRLGRSSHTAIEDAGLIFSVWNCLTPDASVFFEGYRYPVEIRRDGGAIRLVACETFGAGAENCGLRCGTSCAPCRPLQPLPMPYGTGVEVRLTGEEILGNSTDGGCEATRPLPAGDYVARFCLSRTRVDAGLGPLECGDVPFDYPPGGYVTLNAQ